MEILSLSFWGEVRQALSYAYVTLRAGNKKNEWWVGYKNMTPAKKNISKGLSQVGKDHPLPKARPGLLRESCSVSGAWTSQTRWLLRSLLSSAAVMGKRTVWILCPAPMGGFLHGFGRCCECTRRARSLRGPSAPRSGHGWQRSGGCTWTLSLPSSQHSDVWGQNRFQQAALSQFRVWTLNRPCKMVADLLEEKERKRESACVLVGENGCKIWKGGDIKMHISYLNKEVVLASSTIFLNVASVHVCSTELWAADFAQSLQIVRPPSHRRALDTRVHRFTSY